MQSNILNNNIPILQSLNIFESRIKLLEIKIEQQFNNPNLTSQMLDQENFKFISVICGLIKEMLNFKSEFLIQKENSLQLTQLNSYILELVRVIITLNVFSLNNEINFSWIVPGNVLYLYLDKNLIISSDLIHLLKECIKKITSFHSTHQILIIIDGIDSLSIKLKLNKKAIAIQEFNKDPANYLNNVSDKQWDIVSSIPDLTTLSMITLSNAIYFEF